MDGTHLEELQRNYEHEIARLKRERDSSLKNNEGLENKIVQLNETVRLLEERIVQQKLVKYINSTLI